MEINIDILNRFVKGLASADESEMVEKWLAENQISHEELTILLSVADDVKVFEKINVARDWQVVRSRLFVKERKLILRNLIKVAASIAVLISLSGLIYHFYTISHQPVYLSNYSNEVLDYTLPDSSHVFLAQNARISYAKDFAENRTITITGKVFFNVKRDEHKPFIVSAGAGKVKVLGTSFSVDSRPGTVEVNVASGRVAFYTQKAGCDTLILTKGDKALFLGNKLCFEKGIIDNPNTWAWQSHQLRFNNASLGRVIQDIESYFNIKITVTDKSILKQNYTSEFKNPTLGDVLQEMELVLNIKTQIIGQNVKIYSK